MDVFFMLKAIEQATIALEKGEVPVGAVVVTKGRVIAKGYNQTVQLNDATAHAEMIAMSAASVYLKSRYLRDCTLYVTLEPCVMCAGATFWSQIGKVVFGASDAQRGFYKYAPSLLHPKTECIAGVMEEECKALMNTFFDTIRKKR